jgi:hypothetical protein
MSNILRESIPLKSIMTTRTGLRSGRVTEMKLRIGPAPSIEEASLSSIGTLLNPAWARRITKGVKIQTSTRITESSAVWGPLNQSEVGSPPDSKRKFTSPFWVNMTFHIRVAITGGRRRGRTINILKKFPYFPLFKSMAIPTPRIVSMTTVEIAYVNVINKACPPSPEENKFK